MIFNKKKNNLKALDDSSFLVGKQLNFAANEAYKRLRTNIAFSFAKSKDSYVIGVTSTLKGEGKTSVATNLAYSLAESGKKTLLLEADLRMPTLGNRLSLNADSGLSNILVGQVKYIQDIIQEYKQEATLDVITSGSIPPNPAELLDSKKMEKILELLNSVYEYVIIDLPPTSLVADPLIMAKHLDGMIFVVKHKYADKPTILNSIEQLKRVDTKILGFVYTSDGVDDKKSYKYKKYYKNGYYKK